jgi:hypothetical protein
LTRIQGICGWETATENLGWICHNAGTNTPE